MSTTSAKPKIQKPSQNHNQNDVTFDPLRIVGVILAILFILRGHLIEAAIQFLIIATVPVSDNLGGAGFSMFWHALILAVYSPYSAASFYNTYHLIESNNTSALSNDTVVITEILPSDYLCSIVFVSLLGGMLLMLHETITDVFVKTTTHDVSFEKERTELASAVASAAIITLVAFLAFAYHTQGVYREIFLCLTIFEMLMMATYANGIQVLPVFHCFYLLAVGSFLLFAWVLVGNRHSESYPVTVMMSAPWWDGVRNFLDYFSFFGICAAGIFWFIRLIFSYKFVVYSAARHRIRNNLLLPSF